MSPHSDPSRCVRWSCDAPCRKLLFIVSEKVRQMAPGVGLGRPSSGPEEATSKWGRSYKWVADLKITWRGGKRRGTVTDRASRRGGEGRGGEGRWDGTIGSPAQRIGASLRHATTSIIPEGMEASSPWLYNDTCPSESLRKKGIQGKILSVEGRGGGGNRGSRLWISWHRGLLRRMERTVPRVLSEWDFWVPRTLCVGQRGRKRGSRLESPNHSSSDG